MAVGMTNSSPSTPPCTTCAHDQDEHVLAALPTGHPVPMGLLFCPVADCECAATWRAGTGQSTAAEIHETRALVRETLARMGLQIPLFLR